MALKPTRRALSATATAVLLAACGESLPEAPPPSGPIERLAPALEGHVAAVKPLGKLRTVVFDHADGFNLIDDPLVVDGEQNQVLLLFPIQGTLLILDSLFRRGRAIPLSKTAHRQAAAARAMLFDSGQLRVITQRGSLIKLRVLRDSVVMVGQTRIPSMGQSMCKSSVGVHMRVMKVGQSKTTVSLSQTDSTFPYVFGDVGTSTPKLAATLTSPGDIACSPLTPLVAHSERLRIQVSLFNAATKALVWRTNLPDPALLHLSVAKTGAVGLAALNVQRRYQEITRIQMPSKQTVLVQRTEYSATQRRSSQTLGIIKSELFELSAGTGEILSRAEIPAELSLLSAHGTCVLFVSSQRTPSLQSTCF